MGEPRNGPLQQALRGVSGVLSVPQVFVCGRFVGGGDDMGRMLKDGSLRKLLESEGVELE